MKTTLPPKKELDVKKINLLLPVNEAMKFSQGSLILRLMFPFVQFYLTSNDACLIVGVRPARRCMLYCIKLSYSDQLVEILCKKYMAKRTCKSNLQHFHVFSLLPSSDDDLTSLLVKTPAGSMSSLSNKDVCHDRQTLCINGYKCCITVDAEWGCCAP